jgi:serine/threonine protein kinase
MHQDITYENILINHHGKIPSSVVWTNHYEPPTKIIPPPEFRSTFPVRYYLIDFGFAHDFPKHLRLEECIIEPFSNGREQRPPEADRHKRYNPFAADVYQAARLFYGWFAVSDLPLYVIIRNTDSRPIGRGTRCARLSGSSARHVVLQRLQSNKCYRGVGKTPCPALVFTV